MWLFIIIYLIVAFITTLILCKIFSSGDVIISKNKIIKLDKNKFLKIRNKIYNLRKIK